MVCQTLRQAYLQEVGMMQIPTNHVNGASFGWESRDLTTNWSRQCVFLTKFLTFDTQELAHKNAHQLTCTNYNLTCSVTCEEKNQHINWHVRNWNDTYYWACDILGPLHTWAKSRDREIVRAQKKVSKGRPKTPPKSCSVVTDPQV